MQTLDFNAITEAVKHTNNPFVEEFKNSYSPKEEIEILQKVVDTIGENKDLKEIVDYSLPFIKESGYPIYQTKENDRFQKENLKYQTIQSVEEHLENAINKNPKEFLEKVLTLSKNLQEAKFQAGQNEFVYIDRDCYGDEKQFTYLEEGRYNSLYEFHWDMKMFEEKNHQTLEKLNKEKKYQIETKLIKNAIKKQLIHIGRNLNQIEENLEKYKEQSKIYEAINSFLKNLPNLSEKDRQDKKYEITNSLDNDKNLYNFSLRYPQATQNFIEYAQNPEKHLAQEQKEFNAEQIKAMQEEAKKSLTKSKSQQKH